MGVAELGQRLGGEGAAGPACAVQDDLGCLVGKLLLGLRLEVAPGDVDRSRNEAGSELVLLPHIYQGGSFPDLQPLLQIVQRDEPHALSHFREQVRIGLGHPLLRQTRIFRCGHCSIGLG